MYKSALTDTAIFYSITKSQNDIGAEEETESIRYASVLGKIAQSKKATSAADDGAIRNFISQYYFQTTPEYDGGERNDKVVIEGSKYVIVEVRKIKGMSTTPKLILYILEKIIDET